MIVGCKFPIDWIVASRNGVLYVRPGREGDIYYGERDVCFYRIFANHCFLKALRAPRMFDEV